MDINLHSIFRTIVSDKHFMAEVIEIDCTDIEDDKNKKDGFKIMSNMTKEYITLSPFETQAWDGLPDIAKKILPDSYIRAGIKNIATKNMKPVNISFLNSLNVLLRPELYFDRTANTDDQIHNCELLKSYIENMIIGNFSIDKIKNTRKVKAANRALADILTIGKMTHTLIKRIIDIFEINLLVLDVSKNTGYFYWTHGSKYPDLNLFKNIFCMTYIEGNYEPLLTDNFNFHDSQDYARNIYVNILKNTEIIHKYDEIRLSDVSAIYLFSWGIDHATLADILDIHYAYEEDV